MSFNAVSLREVALRLPIPARMLRGVVRAGPRAFPRPVWHFWHAQRVMGKSDVFDKAVAACAVAHADRNESDHAALARAVEQGKVEAVVETNR